MWTRTPHQYCRRARLTQDCPFSHDYDVPGQRGVPYGKSDHQTSDSDAQNGYTVGLVARVAEDSADGGVRAQVAALAVRGIVDFGGPEWAALTSTYGDPGTRDWAMAQNAYGPARQLPGWTYVDRFALPVEGFTDAQLDDRLRADGELTESEARALDGNR